MFSGFSLSIILLVIVSFFFGIDYGFMNRFDRERAARKGWSWDYTLFTIGIALLVILQPWLLPSLGWTTNDAAGRAIQFLGMAAVLAAFGVHIWARQHLRHYYAERVEVQDHHQVIQTGPYALVRHPIITSFFGLAFGILFINPSVVTLALVIYTVWDFSRAARQEEELLSSSLSGYSDYMERVPRFFPRIGR